MPKHPCEKLTILRSLVIDSLRDQFHEKNVAVAHLYFNYRDQADQTADNSIASLVKQLAIAHRGIPKPILELYRKLKAQERRPQLQDLEQAFRLTSLNFERVFVIVDALDECNATYRKRFLRSLNRLQNNKSIRVLMTSRFYEEYINQLFGPCPKINIQAQESDLRKYTANQVEHGIGCDIIDEHLRELIIEKAVYGSQNM